MATFSNFVNKAAMTSRPKFELMFCEVDTGLCERKARQGGLRDISHMKADYNLKVINLERRNI